MNVLRSLIGKVWQDPSATELAKISNGQLYLIRPGNVRSSRECIFNDAMATVRRAQLEHHFELVITRVFENGDQELLEEDDETDDERSFLIGHELEFRPGKTPDGEPNYVWRDLQGDVDELFEFVPYQANETTLAAFEGCVYRGMYERKYKTSSESTAEADLEEFIHRDGATSQPSSPARKKASAGSSELDWDPDMPSPLSSQEVLTLATGTLHRWLPEKFTFSPEGTVQARILKRTTPPSPYEFWLTVTHEDENNPVIAHRITNQMNQRLSERMNTLTWNHIGVDGAQRSWLLHFGNKDAFEEMHQRFSRSIWETNHQQPFSKLKPIEQDYVFTSLNDDVEMKDVEDEDDDEDQVMDELKLEQDAEEEDDEEEDETQPYDSEEAEALAAFNATDARNSDLAVAYRGDRFYVVRGDRVGVFRPGERDGQASYVGSTPAIKAPKGKEFEPEQVMLHEQDAKMILMNPANHNALYSLDIETGKVVEEWKIHEDVEVDHIAPDNKFAPTTTERTFVGASHNGLFRIDPRLNNTKLVESQFKQYASKNKFSGVATTAAGKLAVASEKGDIRLFDSIGKNAKTALPPLGDPIIGVDTSADGRWVVATTKTYLLLIDTLIGEGKYAGSLGFDRSFPADSKPIPRRLQIKAEHAQYMGGVSFSPARFNTGERQSENAIVTSSGQYVIAWDFAKVKKGQLDKYEIKKYESSVVQDNFRFGDDKQIVVALDNNVFNVNKQSLRKPNKVSLGPRSSTKSRSSIVNSPF